MEETQKETQKELTVQELSALMRRQEGEFIIHPEQGEEGGDGCGNRNLLSWKLSR